MEKDKLKYKDYLTIWTCSLSFLLGWILTVVGFILPPSGEVSDSVLWILGQSLLYTGACIGISGYYSSQLKNFKAEVRKELNKE